MQRDEKGRFLKGNPGGPGRPRGNTTAGRLSVDDLHRLSRTIEPGEEYISAMMMRSPLNMEDVEQDFPPTIVQRVQQLITLRDLAAEVLVKRLRDELEDG